MNEACRICQGACCESIVLALKAVPFRDREWLSLHGRVVGETVELPCKCNELTAEGRCGVWAIRPGTCRAYEVGGKACRNAIERRRSQWPEWRRRIEGALP